MTSRAEKRKQTWKFSKSALKEGMGIYGVVPKTREDFEYNFAQLEYIRSIFFPNQLPMDKSVIKIIKK